MRVLVPLLKGTSKLESWACLCVRWSSSGKGTLAEFKEGCSHTAAYSSINLLIEIFHPQNHLLQRLDLISVVTIYLQQLSSSHNFHHHYHCHNPGGFLQWVVGRRSRLHQQLDEEHIKAADLATKVASPQIPP